MVPSRATPVREVMISTITNAPFLIHSKVLAYEFVNWATHGVFVGSRFVHMAAHVDDLFCRSRLWDIALNKDNPANTYRLNSSDINNTVLKQRAFRAAHPVAANFKLDFPFNGFGAVVDPNAVPLTANLTERPGCRSSGKQRRIPFYQPYIHSRGSWIRPRPLLMPLVITLHLRTSLPSEQKSQGTGQSGSFWIFPREFKTTGCS